MQDKVGVEINGLVARRTTVLMLNGAAADEGIQPVCKEEAEGVITYTHGNERRVRVVTT